MGSTGKTDILSRSFLRVLDVVQSVLLEYKELKWNSFVYCQKIRYYYYSTLFK